MPNSLEIQPRRLWIAALLLIVAMPSMATRGTLSR